MTGCVLIALTLAGISFSILSAGAPASGTFRIDTGADIQADAETVDHIMEVFNRAEKAIEEKDLDALMTVYSEHDRVRALMKEDRRGLWKGLFEPSTKEVL